MAFGFSPDRAERIRTQLDRDLTQVEFYLGHIAKAVPQAGSITVRLRDAGETAQEVVLDLHDLVDERTEQPVGRRC